MAEENVVDRFLLDAARQQRRLTVMLNPLGSSYGYLLGLTPDHMMLYAAMVGPSNQATWSVMIFPRSLVVRIDDVFLAEDAQVAEAYLGIAQPFLDSLAQVNPISYVEAS